MGDPSQQAKQQQQQQQQKQKQTNKNPAHVNEIELNLVILWNRCTVYSCLPNKNPSVFADISYDILQNGILDHVEKQILLIQIS